MHFYESREVLSVFVGSTFEDLQTYRRAVWDALAKLDAQVRGMEYFGSRPGRPVDECLAAVRSCRIYIGIFGMRYGSVPDGDGRSMTHLEYDEAQRCHLPSLIYILDDKIQPVLAAHVEQGAGAARLAELKSQLRQLHVCSSFTTPDDLATKVRRDLIALVHRAETPDDEPDESDVHHDRESGRADATTTPGDSHPPLVRAALPLVTFPDELRRFMRAVEPDVWSGLDTGTRRFITTLGTKLEPLVQIIPATPSPLVLGFEMLALGALGENFEQVCHALADLEPGIVRLQLMLASLKTASLLSSVASREGNTGARHLMFTVNLDPETLDSPHLEELLDRYADLWEDNVVFEINERITTNYTTRLKDLQVDFDLRYCADDVNSWSAAAKSALLDRVELSKVDYSTFQAAMQQRGDSAERAIESIASHRIAGKPLIVEGIAHKAYLRFLTRHWSVTTHGTLFGQGYDVSPGRPWDSWTMDLRTFGLAGGHLLREKRSQRRR